MKKYISVISIVFTASCNYNINHDVTLTVKDTVLVKSNTSATPALNNDTLFVHEQAAVFVIPDSSRIARRKKEIGEENFQIGMDDYAFYLNEAGEFLDSMKIKSFDTKDKKVIKFTGTGNTYEIIECNKLPELWNIYFFDPSKKARQIDMISIEEEYKNYFVNKPK